MALKPFTHCCCVVPSLQGGDERFQLTEEFLSSEEEGSEGEEAAAGGKKDSFREYQSKVGGVELSGSDALAVERERDLLVLQALLHGKGAPPLGAHRADVG